jgi:hypothetical protein
MEKAQAAGGTPDSVQRGEKRNALGMDEEEALRTMVDQVSNGGASFVTQCLNGVLSTPQIDIASGAVQYFLTQLKDTLAPTWQAPNFGGKKLGSFCLTEEGTGRAHMAATLRKALTLKSGKSFWEAMICTPLARASQPKTCST